MKRQIQIAAFLASLMGSSSCTRKDESSVSVNPDFLHVHGVATDQSGLPIANASIFISEVSEPLGATQEDGRFNVTLADTRLAALASERSARLGSYFDGTFRLYVERLTHQPNLVGVTEAIRYIDRDRRDLGNIVMTVGTSITGQVQERKIDGTVTPSTKARVFGANRETTTDENGRFQINTVPSGVHSLYAAKSGFDLTKKEIDVDGSPTLDLQLPWIVFPENLLTGWLLPMPVNNLGDLVRSGHPYRRSFQVSASPRAAFIRFDWDRKLFSSDKSKLTWRSFEDKISYDFPGTGPHKLYFQFASQDKTQFSEVMEINVSIDIFADSSGIVIGDGSGIITSRRVSVEIDLPAAATSMRLSEKLTDFTGERAIPWSEPLPRTEFLFALDDATRANAVRELYCQFRDANGVESVLYRASAQLQIFPPADENIFRIEGGAAQTKKRLVDVSINVPDNAYEMRLYEEQVQGGSFQGGVFLQNPSRRDVVNTFLRVRSEVQYVFLNSGRKTVFLQFRDKDGFVSPVYREQVFVDAFDPEGVGFVINGGSPTSSLRELTLSLLPPNNAVTFHVSEEIGLLTRLPYSLIKDTVPYETNSVGLVILYMQYQDVDGNTSDVYQQEIYIDPFFPDTGDFIINNGDGVAFDPLLQLDIFAPLAATEMDISAAGPADGGNALSCGSRTVLASASDWQPVSDFGELLVATAGTKTICVRFRSAEGDISPFIQRSIIFDPFPPGIAGVLINGGDQVTNLRTVDLDFAYPPAVAAIRISNTEAGLATAPFIVALPTLSYQLVEAPGTHTIYAQFQTVEGDLSPVYVDQIDVILFPATNLTLSINDGDASTTSADVTLSLNPPPAATGVRIVEDSASISTAPVLAVAPSMQWTLSTGLGTKQLFVQFVTDAASVSPIFSDSIEIVP